MTSAIRHRGPDGHGARLFCDQADGVVALGHRRLAIIDLSDAGLQPMANEDESVWITFNGEIYNYRELRHRLIGAGHRFRSESDTEVLVHLYEDLGAELVKELVGMFAFAILDLRSRRLLLARDHLGIKPLYYSNEGGTFTFGSELKAILAARAQTPDVNWQGLYDYFTYLYFPAPETAFENIHQLPPAHTLTFDLRTRKQEVARYWRPRQLEEVSRQSREDVEAALTSMLEKSVERELVSDVPIGLFLSGGIDSAVLAGLATRAGTKPRTFTVDFAGRETKYYSESALASSTSKFLGTDHHELTVDALDPFQMLELIDHFDQPFGNPTFYLQWLISRESREQMTVALSGAGGDELFAGYPRYRATQLHRMIKYAPQPVLRLANGAVNLLRDSHRTMRLRRVRELLSGLNHDPLTSFANWTYYLNEEDKAALLHMPGGVRTESSERHLRRYFEQSQFRGGNRFLDVDLQTFLVDNLLEYTDRMSMAVSMEVRVPLLEPAFVEFALNVPFKWKLNRRGSKEIMRESFRDFLSPEVREAGKRGFNLPLGIWMRDSLDQYFVASQDSNHPLRDSLGGDIGSTWRDDGILDWDCIDRMRSEHRTGRQDLSHELFSIVVFDVWWRKYITGTLPISQWSAAGRD